VDRDYYDGKRRGFQVLNLPVMTNVARRKMRDWLSPPHALKHLPLLFKPFGGVIQRCLVSAGNLVSIGFSGFALIWSSAQ